MRNLILYIALLIPIMGYGQEYAGVRQSACSTTGAVIGNDNPNPDHCYLWELADGLSPDDVNNPNPLVQPRNTTVYTVTVTDQDFSFKAIDRCTVLVDFGGLVINPPYTEPDAEPNQAQATLTVNGNPALGIAPAQVLWNIQADPDNTGCLINSEGVISDCNQSGEVTIRATNGDNPACYADEIFRVNVGVVDVIARDVTNAGREARSGDTLYLVGSGEVEFEAVPNTPAQFPQGQPEWSGDLTPPASGQYVWNTSVGVGTYAVTAGEKTVYVTRILPTPIALNGTLDFTGIKSVLDDLQNALDADPFDNALCTPRPAKIEFPGQIQGAYSSVKVPKYRDPDFGVKRQFSIAVPAFSGGGCSPLPCCFASIPLPNGEGIGIFAYARFNGALTISADLVKDPSMENGNWDGQFSATTTFVFGAGILGFSALGPVGLLGGAEANTTIKLNATANEGKLEASAEWGGLQAQFVGVAYIGVPSDPIFSVTGTAGPYNIIDGNTSDTYTLIDLTTQ